MPRKRFALFLSSCLLWCSAAWAQDLSFRYPHTRYTVANGLPQMQVRSIFVDKTGLVWIGTQGGLAVYDGNEVHTFPDTGPLTEGYVVSAVPGTRGIWVSTLTDCFLYDGLSLHPVGHGILPPESYPLFEDARGYAWFYQRPTTEISLFRQDTLTSLGAVYPALAHIRVLVAWGAPDWDRIYLLDHAGRFYSYSPGDQNLTVDSTTFSRTDNLHAPLFRNLVPEDILIHRRPPAGNTPYGDKDLFRFSAGRLKRVATLDPASGQMKALAPNAPIAFTGFYYGKTTLFIRRDSFYQPSLAEGFNGIRYVNEGFNKIFLGTDDGFVVIHADGMETVDFPACDYAWSVFPAPENQVYIACYKAGLFRFDAFARQDRWFRLPGVPFSTGPDRQVLSNGFVTRDLSVWGGVNGYSFLRGSADTLSYRLTYHSAEAFALDEPGRSLFVGTKEILRFSTPDMDCVDTLPVPEALIGGAYFNDLMLDREHFVWGAAPAGICRVDPDTKALEIFTQRAGRLPCKGAVTLDLDDAGNLWSGGTCGLMILRPGNEVFESVLPDIITARVNQVTLVPGGRLVCASNNNVYVLDIASDTPALVTIYNQKNGAALFEPSENGSCLTNDRFVWMPSVNGIQRLDLRRVPTGWRPANLRVLQVNGEPVAIVGPDIPALQVDGPAALLGMMLVDHSGRNWQFQYVPRGGKPSPWQSALEILVSGLHHGSNEILLRAAWNPADPATYTEAVVRIDAHLPFLSRRNVQFALSILTLSLAALVAAALRSARRNARKAEMLNADLYKNRLQTIQAYFNPHFLFNTLSSIQDKVLRQDADAGNAMIIRLSRVFRKILEAGKATEGKPPFIPMSEELSVIEDMAFLNNMQVEKPVRLRIEVSEEARAENPLIPPMLVQPFVENAFKHAFTDNTPDKEVTVDCQLEGGFISFVIRDNGIGLRGHSSRKGTSMGMTLARERMKILNELNIENDLQVLPAEPTGTEVRIRIKRPV